MNTVVGAINLGILLQWVLDTSCTNMPIPTSDEAKKAALLLVRRASNVGACSVHETDILKHWPSRPGRRSQHAERDSNRAVRRVNDKARFISCQEDND
jgi:hypothetical protein